MAKTFEKTVQGDRDVLVVVDTTERRQSFTLKQLKQRKEVLRAQLDDVQAMIDQARDLDVKEEVQPVIEEPVT